MYPNPTRRVSKSRREIGRWAGTVSAIGPSSRAMTLRSASSGRNRSTGASSRSRHSSTRIIAATATIGSVIDAILKIVSRFIGAVPPNAIVPSASTWTSPRRLTSVTMPGTLPRSTWPAMTSCMRSSRAVESAPTLIVCLPELV
jgi:hypothetical protein